MRLTPSTKKLIATLGSTGVLAMIIGAAVGLISVRTDGGAGLTAGGISQAGGAVDSRIQYPQSLSELPAPPGRLIFDRQGNLWFPLYENGFSDAVIYRYNSGTGEKLRVDLPDRPGSQLYSGLAVLEDGDIVIGYDTIVVVVDSTSKSVDQIELPEKPSAFKQQTYDEGSWITDLAVGNDGRLYVGRMNSTSISSIDLATRSIEEIGIPGSFGPVERIEAASDGLYVSSRFGAIGIAGQTGFVASDGSFKNLGVGSSELVSTPDTQVIASTTGKSLLLLSSDAVSLSPNADAAAAYLNGFQDAVIVDSKGSTWISGRSTGRIAIVAEGFIDEFQLQQYIVPGDSGACGSAPESCGGQVVSTHVVAMAEAPDGSIYFSDSTGLRIGVIPAAY